ncbi:MAG: L,D-transpeptidase, partial [Victivallaceae bacterium]
KITYNYDNYNSPGTSGGKPPKHGWLRIAAVICLLAGLVAGVYYAYAALKRKNAVRPQVSNVQAVRTPLSTVAPAKAVVPVAAVRLEPETKTVAKPEKTKVEFKAVAASVVTESKPLKLTEAKVVNTPAAIRVPVNPVLLEKLPPPDENAIAEICAAAEKAMSAGDPVKASRLAESVTGMKNLPESNPLWLRAAEALSAANTKILLTDIPLPGKKINYVCKNTDFLQNIASAHNTSIELIQLSNRMKSSDSSIWEGRVFRIYKGDWNIRISKQNMLLHLYDGNKLFKIYHVGIGRENRTPEGVFVVRSKIKEPVWYSPNGKIIPYAGAQNSIGSRWISLSPEGVTDKGLRGYGIHGTADPDSIGKMVSNGCVRMRNAEVEELFMIIPRLTPVTIEQ